MNTPDDRCDETVVGAIVAYLHAHPLAADSADGVRRWWLGAPGRVVGLHEVESALDVLVGRSVLRRLPLADGTVLYAPVMATRQ